MSAVHVIIYSHDKVCVRDACTLLDCPRPVRLPRSYYTSQVPWHVKIGKRYKPMATALEISQHFNRTPLLHAINIGTVEMS
jgi:hypothetical protein